MDFYLNVCNLSIYTAYEHCKVSPHFYCIHSKVEHQLKIHFCNGFKFNPYETFQLLFSADLLYISFMTFVPDADTPLAAIDIETTGLHPFYSEIVEIAAVIFSVDGSVIDEYSQLIDPQKPIPPRAMEIHGITEEMVAGKPLWKDIAPRLYEMIRGKILVAHNAPFDLGFLSFKGTVIANPFPETWFTDTLTISREIFPDFPRHTLVDLSKKLGIEHLQAHRALADAMACKCLLVKSLDYFDGNWELFTGQYVYHTAAWQTLDNIDENKMPLVEACHQGYDLSIIYIDSEGVETIRRITPLQLNRIRHVPYLFGHCHLRDAGRNFRLDRIQSWEKIICEK